MSLKTGKPECINCEDLWYFSSCHQLMEKVSLIFITVSLKVEIFPGTIFCKFQSILVKLVLEIYCPQKGSCVKINTCKQKVLQLFCF